MATNLEKRYASEIEGAIRSLYAISDQMYDDGLSSDGRLLVEGISRLEGIFDILKESWDL